MANYSMTKEEKAAYDRKWRRENKERWTQIHRASQKRNRHKYNKVEKAWRAKNKDKVKVYSFNALLRRYALTPEQYAKLEQEQQGCCAICRNPPSSKKRLAIDHDHATGKVRALLCDSCNGAIGLLKESTNLLRDAITYLETHA